MANDRFMINVMLDVTGPKYALTNRTEWNEHFHNNKELKEDVVAAVKELLENTLTVVMVNGVEMPLSDITVQLDGVEVETEEHEQALLDAEDADENARWDAFHAEIARREKLRPDMRFGSYSMGNLSGPISQLDEIAYVGKARVAITDGWDDDGPVYSDSVIENPTNWDMHVMFSEALLKSNDHHHIFLEGVRFVGEQEGVATFAACTGS